jgi:hypothetical protein
MPRAIDYVYGRLYGEVWRALVKVGLDPYFGLIHGSERDHGSMVFDHQAASLVKLVSGQGDYDPFHMRW